MKQILCLNVMTPVMDEIAANRAVTVKMECLVTRKLDSVPRGVPLAMKETTVTKVNNRITTHTSVHVNL